MNTFVPSIVQIQNGSAMDMTKIDPSLALGFYGSHREDYESFEMSLKAMKMMN